MNSGGGGSGVLASVVFLTLRAARGVFWYLVGQGGCSRSITIVFLMHFFELAIMLPTLSHNNTCRLFAFLATYGA